MISLKILWLIIYLLGAGVLSAEARTVIYVDENAPGADNGTSWADAYVQLDSALDAALADTTILVADGNYIPGLAYYDAFYLKDEVTLEGGYAGYGALDPNARDITRYETVLNGEGKNSRVVIGSFVEPTAVLDGFTITGAIGSSDGLGGGIFNFYASPTVLNCTIRDNSAEKGGGVCNYFWGSPTFDNCHIYNNTATSFGQGGGMYNYYSDAHLTHCTFSNNRVLTDGRGGAMYNDKVFGKFDSCTFSNNYAHSEGGIYNTDCDLTVLDCIFTAHSTTAMTNHDSAISISHCTFSENNDILAAGIFNDNSDSEVSHCIFSNNRACAVANQECAPHFTQCTFSENWDRSGGAGIYNRSSEPTIDSCTFSNNFVGMHGGAIYNWVSNSLIVNCLFNGNEALATGGGIYNESSEPTITHCTFSGNTVGVNGGSIFNYYTSAAISNCILWGDSRDELVNHFSELTTVTHNCVKGGFAGEGNIDADPLYVNPAVDDYHLSGLSPCINRCHANGTTMVDMDGDPRPCMGTADMGMDEYTDTHTLAADGFTLRQALGKSISFTLTAGPSYADHLYLILGSMSGTVPGIRLPSGQATLPLNYDHFTEMVIRRLNSSTFHNFLSVLDGAGMASAQLNILPGIIPLGWVGEKMSFAYAIDTYDFVSNPITLQILP